MKICFFGDVRSPHVQKFIGWFAKRGHATALLSFDYLGDVRTQAGLDYFKESHTLVHLLPKGFLPFIPALAWKLAGDLKPDIVQCHFITNYGFLGAFSGLHPLVMSAMGDDVLIHPRKFPIKYAVQAALNRADMVTCDGMNSLEALNKLGVGPERRMLLYPGVDMEKFKPSLEPKDRPFKEVFYPRGFDKIYDVDTLFEVIRIVCDTLPGTQFTLMGIGTELRRFEDKIRSSHLTNSVNYLGNVDNNLVPRLMSRADVSITTSLSDGGIPASTVEAMACGLPVVSTDAGDARLWLEAEGWYGARGYVVDKRNPAMIAEKILDLLRDGNMCAQLGRAGRKFVEVNCDYETEMKKAEKLYEDIIAG